MGKTFPGIFLPAAEKKHPHVRGEDVGLGYACAGAIETPPRSWGRQKQSSIGVSNVRNTPTFVGKTKIKLQKRAVIQKHPHVRGEDGYSASPERKSWETPPRSWGRRRRTVSLCAGLGNTPTFVGKTLPPWAVQLIKKKHPHVRGEDPAGSVWGLSPSETPPRSWGRPARALGVTHPTRNTPTFVGKTWRDGRR